MIVYVLYNSINDKLYIGKTEKPNLKFRWDRHCTAAFTTNSQHRIHKAMRKYGKEAFHMVRLSETNSLGELGMMERYFIEKYHSNDPAIGYNMTEGGEGGWQNQYVTHPRGMLGKKHSAATRQKMRDAHKGLVEGVRHPMYGKKHTPKSRERIAASMRAARAKKHWSTKKV